MQSVVHVRDWAERASKELPQEKYTESAVSLACLLTKRLIQITTDGSPLLQGIPPKTALLLVPHPQSIIVEDVEFQFESSDADADAPHISHSSAANADLHVEKVPLGPPKLYNFLGKILLEVFLGGRSAESIADSSTDIHNGSDNSIDAPPARKRYQSEAAATGGFTPSSAYNRLDESGMPLSICHLVRDLLDPKEERINAMPFTSVKEIFWDLTQMRVNPRLFLFDRTCPKIALEDTCLYGKSDEHLFGREQEISHLLRVKNEVSTHVMGGKSVSSFDSRFLCEMVFLGGYAGSGKSSLLGSLLTDNDEWFFVSCKFSKKAAPWMILANAFNDLFGKWTEDRLTYTTTGNDNPMQLSFQRFRSSILSTIDNDGFDQLSDLIPNFAGAYPRLAPRKRRQYQEGLRAMDKVGSAHKRRLYLFQVLFKSLCSVGHPVLISVDDLQWSDSFFMNAMEDFIVNIMDDTSLASDKLCPKQGLLISGAFRSNEVKENDDLFNRINRIKQSGKAKVTILSVGGISKSDVTKLISAKLCLPWRYTMDLAAVVHTKTASGNPFHVRSFLRAIIQNKLLKFSVKRRRWVWDCDTVNLQMILDDVAKLLIATFSKLPSNLIQTVKIVSCLGSHVERTTIEIINSGEEFLRYDMVNELEVACQEGIMEKAGGMFAYTHDIIQQTVYGLTPESSQNLVHKKIGDALLKSSANDSKVHLLAVDQVNMYIKDGSLTPEERSHYAHANVTASKFAIAACSFEQARSYTNTGMKLLDDQHWQTQYHLSLALFDLAASLSCMCGDIETMTSYLDESLAHAQSFHDTLKASALLSQLLASRSKNNEALNNCLGILSNLGEDFPPNTSLPNVLDEISGMRTLLRNISLDQIKMLSPMTSADKLWAMMFLNISSSICGFCKPLLLPFLSNLMLRLTLTHGFCDDSIVGLAECAFCLFTFTEDYHLARQIGRISELLIEESPNRHALRSRLSFELGMKSFTEPAQLVISSFPELLASAMIAGDTANAVRIRAMSCATEVVFGTNLVSATANIAKCMQEAAKYQQDTDFYTVMPVFNFCFDMTGEPKNNTNIKSYAELKQLGKSSSIATLLFQNLFWRMSYHFWMRDYLEVAKLSEQIKPSPYKRVLHNFAKFYEGIAFLSLARDTQQGKWRSMGEMAVKNMAKWATTCEWNFGNKHKLLQAELHYLNDDFGAAEAAYKASIKSARESKFYHEEALALELYGFFCLENGWIDTGKKCLCAALDLYKEWGATNKVHKLQLSIVRA